MLSISRALAVESWFDVVVRARQEDGGGCEWYDVISRELYGTGHMQRKPLRRLNARDEESYLWIYFCFYFLPWMIRFVLLSVCTRAYRTVGSPLSVSPLLCPVLFTFPPLCATRGHLRSRQFVTLHSFGVTSFFDEVQVL